LGEWYKNCKNEAKNDVKLQLKNSIKKHQKKVKLEKAKNYFPDGSKENEKFK